MKKLCRPKRYTPPCCPVCGAWSEVTETRTHKDGTTKRRHECANLHRFTTYCEPAAPEVKDVAEA